MTTEAPTEPVDATIVEDHPHEPAPRAHVAEPPPATTALAVRERRSEVIRPLDTAALVESFKAYQELLPQLLTDDDYQEAGRGKRFVTKSGWRKIAAAFDLDVQILRTTVDRDFAGIPQRAEVWARAISPSGRAMDGDGYCDITEERFNERGGRKKLENDLRTTATTRAFNRAISGLIGMGDADDAAPSSAPAIVEADDELRAVTRAALGYLLDGDVTAADELVENLTAYFDDSFPAIAAQAIAIVAKAVKVHREARAAEAAAA